MVLTSISPLFHSLGHSWRQPDPDHYFIVFCGLMVLLPNAFLWLRIGKAKRNNDRREVTVGPAR